MTIGQRGDIIYGDMGLPGAPGRDGAPAPYGEKGRLKIVLNVYQTFHFFCIVKNDL